MSTIPPVNESQANTYADAASRPKEATVSRPTPLGDDVIKKLTIAFAGPDGIGAPGAGNERDVDLTSIKKGDKDTIEIGLRSGGGTATVTLDGDKATFNMPTPAFLNDKPGVVTQNVVEYEIDLANPANAREAGLVDDLAAALESADDSGMIPPEAALLETARERVDQPDVLVPRTTNILQSIVRELLEKLLGEASTPEIKDCLTRFKRIPVSEIFQDRAVNADSTLRAFGAAPPAKAER